MPRLTRLFPRALVALLAVAAVHGGLAPAGAEATGTIAGATFQDLNRNGARDDGEPALVNQQLYLFDGTGAFRAVVYSDGAGRYQFAGLPDGSYRLAYASPSWSVLRNDWVPTTTGSVYPSTVLTLSGSASVDFGWRPIVWSTDLRAPVSTYVGPSGLRAESFNDAVPAVEVHDFVLRGRLVGPEAANTTVRMGHGEINEAPTGIGQSNGVYNTFNSTVYVTWGAWLDDRDATVFHEYGHSWSLYNAYLVQQDGTFSSYVEARGLAGDSRVGTSYKWSPGEMIAEDYRQLFGTPAAALRPQANNEIPRAEAVPGLADFLSRTFTAPPPGSEPAPAPPPAATALEVEALAMSPTAVTKSGTVSFGLTGPASVSVDILDAAGTVVRSLAAGRAMAGGPASLTWDRTVVGGRRAKAGSYRVQVQAVAAGGEAATATAEFTVR